MQTANFTTRPRSARDRNAEGYTFVQVRGMLHEWVIVKPDGTVYRVDLSANTCTCRAGELGKPTCCHRQECWRRVMRAGAAFIGEVDGVAETTRPAPVVNTAHGFGSRAAFEKARSADFD